MDKLRQAEWYLLLLCVYSIPLFESPKNILSVVVAFLFIVRHVQERNLGRSLLSADPRLGFLALSASAAISAAFATDPALAAHGSYDFLKMYFLFAVVATDFSDRKSVKALVAAVILSAAAGSVWGFANYMRGETLYFELHSVGFTNHTAIYLGLCLIASFYYFFSLADNMKNPETIAVAVGSILILCALLLSSARETLLGSGRMLFVFFILFFLKNKRISKVAWAVSALALFALASVAMFHKSFTVGGIYQRFAFWELSWAVFKASPLLGVGANHFQFVNPADYGFANNTYLKTLSHPHSLYFTILSQMGALGAAALALLFALIVKVVLRTDKTLRPLVISVSLAILVIGLVNTTLHTEQGMLFALLVAMASGASTGREQE